MLTGPPGETVQVWVAAMADDDDVTRLTVKATIGQKTPSTWALLLRMFSHFRSV